MSRMFAQPARSKTTDTRRLNQDLDIISIGVDVPIFEEI